MTRRLQALLHQADRAWKAEEEHTRQIASQRGAALTQVGVVIGVLLFKAGSFPPPAWFPPTLLGGIRGAMAASVAAFLVLATRTLLRSASVPWSATSRVTDDLLPAPGENAVAVTPDERTALQASLYKLTRSARLLAECNRAASEEVRRGLGHLNWAYSLVLAYLLLGALLPVGSESGVG